MSIDVYLAGKITDTTWRNEIVGEGTGLLIPDGYGSFPFLSDVIVSQAESFGYVGPFFVDGTSGHGPLLTPASHGILDGVSDGDEVLGLTYNAHSPFELRREVFSECISAIEYADVIFAWIDRLDVYGTIAEIGIASRAGKEVWIGFPSDFDADELWFVRQLADCVVEATSAKQAFDGCVSLRLEYLLASMPYDSYLTTNHWQRLRQQTLEYAEGRCQLCNSDQNIHIHHRSYERRGCELPADLTALCAECHAHFHQIVNGRPTRMPVRAA